MTGNRRFLLILLMLVAVVIAACGGDDGGDDPLPDDGPPGAAENDNLPPGFDPDAEVTPDGGAAAELPPGLGDASDGPPGVDLNEEGGGDDLPFDDSGPPVFPDGGPGAIIDDFSTLQPGQTVTLSGQAILLPEEDANGNRISVLVDESGNEVRFTGLPVDIINSMADGRWNLTGTIQDEADATGRLVLEARADQMPTAVLPGNVGVDGANPGIDSPFPLEDIPEGDPNLPAFPGQPPGLPGSEFINTGVTVAVEGEFTALNAYDALVAALGDDLANTQLMDISGNMQNGWAVNFNLTDADLTTTYIVTADGVVRNSPPTPIIDLPIAPTVPFDRALVLVDSDVAAAQLLPAEADAPPVGALATLSLRGVEGGGIVWSSPNNPGVTLDATTAP